MAVQSDLPRDNAVLIDGATLQATARILGKLASVSSDYMDSEISAYENFIVSALFFDRVLYSPTKRNKIVINRLFGRLPPSFIQPVPMRGEKSYADFCRKIVTPNLISIDSSGFNVGLLKDLLETIKQSLSLTWHVDSGHNILAGRILGKPLEEIKLDPLVRMMLSSISVDTGFRDFYIDIDERGFQYTSDYKYYRNPNRKYFGYNGDFYDYVRALNWLLFRSIYYCLLAKHYGFSVSLHPVRSLCCARIPSVKFGVPEPLCGAVASILAVEGSSLSRELRGSLEPSVLTLDLPFFSAWVASRKSGNSTNGFMDEVLKLRASADFTKLRKIFRDIHFPDNPAGVERSIIKHNKNITDLKRYVGFLRRKYGLESEQGILTGRVVALINTALSFSPIAVRIPDLGVKIPERYKEFLGIAYRNPYKQIFRSAIRDIASIPRLGGIYEIITKDVRLTNKWDRENEYLSLPWRE